MGDGLTNTHAREQRPFSPPSHQHDPADLEAAHWLSLGRVPDTEAAHALVARIAEDIRPHLGSRTKAALGNRDKGKERRVRETGIILAGLLRRGLKGHWSAVNESPSTWFWKASRKLPVKHTAFQTKVDAMQTLGLLDHVPGKSFKGAFGDYQGHAARLRPSKKLLELAEQYGCLSQTAAQDWKLINPAPVERMATHELLSFTTIPRKRNGRIDPASRSKMDIPAGCEDLLAFMKALTSSLATVVFTGCAEPVFQARFSGVREFGGRIYAQGPDNYQNGISKDERQHITINGEPVAELDLSASFLSIALALLNQPAPEGDPYALPGLEEAHRAAIKQWFVVFWQTGKAPNKWSDKTPLVIRDSIPPTDITGPAFERYPALKDIKSIVPEALLKSVEKPMRSWAVGQYLTGVEAGIMREAMSSIMETGGIVLPVHDSLIVPRSLMEIAQSSLGKACLNRIYRKIDIKNQ